MNTIITILNSLKIDSTFLVQFVIFVVFFNLIAPILFKRLQAVIDLRESKTTKLDSDASHIYKQVEDLEIKYKGTIEKAHQDNQVVATKKKSEIQDKEKALLTAEENKLENEYDVKRKALLADLASKKSIVFAEADKLSNSLVEKLTK